MNRLLPMVVALFGIYGCATTTTQTPAAAPEPTPVATPAAHVDKVEKPAPAPVEPPPEVLAEQEFRQGVSAYENGQYKKSQQQLQKALSLGLGNKADRVAANKYLAFMACASQQRDICKSYFRKALAIDPKFELGKAEAGHPMWGRVFREVKAPAPAKTAPAAPSAAKPPASK